MYIIKTIYITTKSDLYKTVFWGKTGQHQILDGKNRDLDVKWAKINGIALSKHIQNRIDKIPAEMYVDGRDWFLAKQETIKLEEN